ncbi:MAG: helix-turn-helix transcriptional regulator [Methylococcales bacterium]|nr:helix-turn-helix transcriptional regulator [Methylococcales bacterium]
MTRAAVGQWENANPARRHEPRMEQIKVVAKLTKAPLSWLLSDDSEIKGDWHNKDRDKSITVEPFHNFSVDVTEKYIGIPLYISGVPDQHDTVEHIVFLRSWLNQQGLAKEALVSLFVQDEGMSPRIRQGDVVLLKTDDDNLIDHAVYAFNYFGQPKLKRVQKMASGALMLSHDNDAELSNEVVQPNEVDSLKIIGRVVWMGGNIGP